MSIPDHDLFSRIVLALAGISIALAAACADPPEVAKAKTWQSIPVRFYRWKFGEKNHLRADQIVHVAENILAAQNKDGGWGKNHDLSTLKKPKPKGRSTFDNLTTYRQLMYLARVRKQTGLTRYDEAIEKGIRYVLKKQHPMSGGWRGADVDAVTYNDDVMANVMGFLYEVASNDDLYAWLDKDLRSKARAAYKKGLAVILKTQIKVGDRLTAWCQQHDHKTLKPVWARAFEPPSIVTSESVGVVRLLMSIENPPPDVITSIQAAVAWFDRVKIEGLRIDKVKADPVKFRHHQADFDKVEVKDPNAPPIWTRYYDLKSEKPIFCTRKRKITSDFKEVSRERRTGYSWHGYYPAKLLEKEYPKWQKKWAPDRNVLKR